jgi:hypothetical protein
MPSESAIKMEKMHQQAVARRALQEASEALRLLAVLTDDPAEDDKIVTIRDQVNDLTVELDQVGGQG